MRQLQMHTPEISFSIQLADTVTAVYGAGNTGKTCIFNKLIEAVNNKRIADDYLFINMQMLYNVKLLQNKVKALFIIDDFDVVRIVHPEIVTYLNEQQNQVLLFGRNLDDLRIDKRYMYRTERQGNTIVFKPLMNVPLRG